jgi:hypothetical protein
MAQCTSRAVLLEGVESATCRYTSATRFLWVAKVSASTIKATAGIGCGAP